MRVPGTEKGRAHVRSDVLTLVTTETAILWDVMTHSLINGCQSLEGRYNTHPSLEQKTHHVP
jgi:hypothetical protein